MRQAIKNGTKCTLRTPAKTALFLLVQTVLAVLVTVAFGVCAAVQGYLRDCDAYFHTIAQLEYIGRDYPHRMVCDEALTAAVEENAELLQELTQAPGVMSVEAAGRWFAVADGLHRMDRDCYDADEAVLFVYILGEDPASNSLVGQIRRAYYARDSVEGKSVRLRTDTMDDPSAPQMQLGETYLVAGHFFRGTNNYLWFQAESQEYPGEAGVTVPAFEAAIEGEIAEENVYLQLAELMAARNNSLRVQFTSSLEDQKPFHQQELLLSGGRSFTAEEYEDEANVCVISDRISGIMNLSVGDYLDLSLYEGADISRVFLSPLQESGRYEIVGTYGATQEYPDGIYLPQNRENPSVLPGTGYLLGQFRVENRLAEAFLQQAQPLTEAGFRITLYDQGWSAAAKPMEELLLISGIFLAICLLLSVSALLLQCWLFVTRQRDAARTMFAMGSGRAHVYVYFLSAAVLIALPAAVIGCLAGKGMEQQVFHFLRDFTRQYAEQDLRFSVSRISFARTLDFSPEFSLPAMLCAGGVTVFCAGAFSVLFTASALNERKRGKAKRHRRSAAPRRGRTLPISGALKYAVLSAVRSRGRSLAVVLLGAVAAVFFGQLTSSLEDYRAQLDAVRENTVISGHATDMYGQKIQGLVLRKSMIESAAASEVFAQWAVSDTIGNCRVLGVSVTAEGEVKELPDPYVPQGSFGVETFFAQMAYEPDWVRTTSVEGSYVFRYSEARQISWLEGYGEQDFSGSGWICALPQSVMERHGISLGDTVRFQYAIQDGGVPVISTVDILVAASYVSSTETDVVFCPIQFSWRNPEARMENPIGGSYDSFLFTLRDTAELDAARQALEEAGFTPVRTNGRTRTYAVIEDEVFLNTTQSMERQIRYVGALYDGLYVLAGLIGMALAWLLASSRRSETALLRALGTPPVRILLNFFCEQAVLCGVGLLLGYGLWQGLSRPVSALQQMLTVGFFVLWCVSSLICLAGEVRKRAKISLSEPE